MRLEKVQGLLFFKLRYQHVRVNSAVGALVVANCVKALACFEIKNENNAANIGFYFIVV